MEKKIKPKNCIFDEVNRRAFINFDVPSADYMIDLVRRSKNNYTVFIIISSKLFGRRCDNAMIHNNIVFGIKHMYYYIKNNLKNDKFKIVLCPMMNKMGYEIADSLRMSGIPIKVQGSRNFMIEMDKNHDLYHEIVIRHYCYKNGERMFKEAETHRIYIN